MGMLATVILLVVSFVQGTRITPENARAIREGMTLSEVERLLGPERDETAGLVIGLGPLGIERGRPRTTIDRQWVSLRAVINVGFNQTTGRVVEICPYDATVWDPVWWGMTWARVVFER